jgi:Ser/Thr protein kinase RdoA (MazF antagonist)
MSWTTATAKNILDTACSALGLSYDQLSLLRFGTNAIYHIKPNNLVVKISRPNVSQQEAIQEIEIMRWLDKNSFPTITPNPMTSEPLSVYGSQVSVWPFIDSHQLDDYQLFGELLKQLHAVPRPEFGLKECDPFQIINKKLEQLKTIESVSNQDVNILQEWSNWLKPQFFEQESELGSGILHGDAHIGNCLINKENNQPLMIDFDFICYGPKEWDLIPEALGPRRFNLSRDFHQQFVNGYGYDIVDWPGFHIFALTRELLITCWRFEVESGGVVRSEGEKRMQYWRREPQPSTWKSF